MSPGDNLGDQSSQIGNVPPRDVCIQAPIPNAHFLNVNAYATGYKHNEDLITDLLGDQGTPRGR